jgi:hypothetical protein
MGMMMTSFNDLTNCKEENEKDNKDEKEIIWIEEELERTVEMEIDDMRERLKLPTIHR